MLMSGTAAPAIPCQGSAITTKSLVRIDIASVARARWSPCRRKTGGAIIVPSHRRRARQRQSARACRQQIDVQITAKGHKGRMPQARQPCVPVNSINPIPAMVRIAFC